MYQQIKKGALALSLSLCCVGAFAQKTITGNVKDATGEPLIGVTMAHPINQGENSLILYMLNPLDISGEP